MKSRHIDRTGKMNIRLVVLLLVLLVVGAAFLYDKYVLLPSAQEKIEMVANDVTMSLNDGNRKQVEDIVGIAPAAEFKHKGLDVVQYRFSRGLPFYPRPILDIAYRDGAIVRVKTTELTPEILDGLANVDDVRPLDREGRESVQLIGLGGGGNSGDSTSGDSLSLIHI